MAPFDSTRAHLPTLLVPTPKLSAKEKRNSLYPYYAGFSEPFVTSLMHRLGVQSNHKVLDPWNGTGTTTYVAANLGAEAVGVDVNPVLSRIALARSAGPRAVAQAKRALTYALSEPSTFDTTCTATAALRAVHNRALAALASSGKSQAAALIDTVAYRAVRGLAAANRSMNPSWFKAGALSPDVTASQAIAEFRSVTGSILERPAQPCPNSRRAPSIQVAAFENWPGIRKAHFDFVITSPPYLTRIDYVKSMYPELTYHFHDDPDIVEALRHRMLGTSLTKESTVSSDFIKSITASDTLSFIYSHPSKASKTYYYRFYKQYFVGLQRSMSRIAHTLTKGGTAAIVVQGSYYKERMIDLPSIVREMLQSQGLGFVEAIAFATPRLMTKVNRRAPSSRLHIGAPETVVIMKKGQNV